MEETMKASILYMDGHGFKFRQKVNGISNLFNNHQLRYPLAMFLSVIHIITKDFGVFLNRFHKNPQRWIEIKDNREYALSKFMDYVIQKLQVVIPEVLWFSNAEIYRQEALYVDFDDQLKTPLSANKQQFEDVKLRIDSLREFSKYFFNFCNTKEHGNSEMIEEFKNMLIDKRWYNEIGKLIKTIRGSESNPLVMLSNELNNALK
ncbi:MAG: hypothetical protein EOP48_31190, partial [Sphingobacteriales bacterium]